MRKQSLAFLIVGFAVGFAVLFFWTRNREAQIISATPLPLAQQPAAPQQGLSAPPVDMALVQQLQARTTANPSDYEAFVQLANIHYDQRNYADAENMYKKALSIRGDDLDVRTDLGTMLFYQNKFDEAMSQLNQVLAKNPNHGQALFNVGIVYLHGRNDPQSALQTWEKLVATNPDFPQIAAVQEQIESLKASLKK